MRMRDAGGLCAFLECPRAFVMWCAMYFRASGVSVVLLNDVNV